MGIEIEFFPEICCEICNEVIHNHFSCPVCKNQYAATNIYIEVEDSDMEFSCEECGAKFLRESKGSKTWEVANGKP